MKDKVNTEDLVVDPQTKGYLVDRKELIEKLLKTNVNEHTEKKNGLTYLSWAWAWAEALKADSSAWYKIEMFGDKCYMDINGTAMVFVTVTMYGKPMTCQLPVMDYRNKAIPNPDAFAVNTAIMRCMTKAQSCMVWACISMRVKICQKARAMKALLMRDVCLTTLRLFKPPRQLMN